MIFTFVKVVIILLDLDLIRVVAELLDRRIQKSSIE